MKNRSHRRICAPTLWAGVLTVTAAVVAATAPATPAAATTVSVATETEYRAALADLSADAVGPHTIEVTADISFSQTGDPVYSGSEELTIDGNGFTIDANRMSRVLRSTNAAAKVIVTDVTVTGGQPGYQPFTGACCGGLQVAGDLDVVRSTLVDNKTLPNGDAGAASARGTMTVIDSSVVGNFAYDDNGGIGGDVIIVMRSTIADNTAAGYRGSGGGIYGREVAVINSTVSGNRLLNGRGDKGGGGIRTNGPLTLLYATVVDNDGPAGQGENVRAYGDAATLTSFGSVIAMPGGSANCVIDGPTVSTYSYDDDGSCGLAGTGDTSAGGAVLLGALADNGGPTPTHLPAPDSVLVDAIPAAYCDSSITVDQRGLRRPQGPGCDLGAVEVEVPNEPPVCDAAEPSVGVLWPPSHEMIDVEVVGVSDPDGDALTVGITSIFQDEPVNDTGDGVTAPDASGLDTSMASVRAERSGDGNGRVYHVRFVADDEHGGSCVGEVTVSVPKSQGKKGAAIDDGALFDSTSIELP